MSVEFQYQYKLCGSGNTVDFKNFRGTDLNYEVKLNEYIKVTYDIQSKISFWLRSDVFREIYLRFCFLFSTLTEPFFRVDLKSGVRRVVPRDNILVSIVKSKKRVEVRGGGKVEEIIILCTSPVYLRVLKSLSTQNKWIRKFYLLIKL